MVREFCSFNSISLNNSLCSMSGPKNFRILFPGGVENTSNSRAEAARGVYGAERWIPGQPSLTPVAEASPFHLRPAVTRWGWCVAAQCSQAVVLQPPLPLRKGEMKHVRHSPACSPGSAAAWVPVGLSLGQCCGSGFRACGFPQAGAAAVCHTGCDVDVSLSFAVSLAS